MLLADPSTAPLPLIRAQAQSAPYRIAVDVLQLLHNLPMIANIEVIVSFPPEVLGLANQSSRYALFV
jgi:hypothetical protein